MATTSTEEQFLKTPQITKETSRINISSEDLLEVAQKLHKDENLSFEHLSFVTAVDYVDHLELVYHFYSYKRKHELTLTTSLPMENPEIDSLTSIWIAADWHEREVYDLFGIKFKGHPNLTRIFLREDFPGHPLRKDFPCQNDDDYLLNGKNAW
jgi:NADH-quinone oxidoreductase subunit C